MTIRSGVDIVDIPKFAKNLKSRAFIRKVFTPDEIMVCEADINPTKCYAAKFAVKEAFMKAIRQGIRQEVWFTQIEVVDKNSPTIQTQGKAKQTLSKIGGKNISTSLSQSREMVLASVIFESQQ